MVHEALRREAREQTLYYSLLKMKLDNLICNFAGIFEYDWPNRGVVAPFPELFVAFARNPERIHGLCPCGIRTLVKRRKRASHMAIATRDIMQRFSAQDLECRGDCQAEMLFGEANLCFRSCQQRSQAFNLFAQFSLAFARGFKLFIHNLTLATIKVSLLDFLRQRFSLVAADAALHQTIMPAVDHLGQTAKLLAGSISLSDQCLKNPVFGPLLLEKVVAIDALVGLKLAVNSSVALLHAAGVAGQVKVKLIPAVGLRIEPFAGSVRSN